ncbi:hypothetical protein CVT24_012996 [Panaeolus cyanescens]|uniref:F-box domain-containing protein n=1 Tax=Panaeolus cyanescens TaxID=181874 RepID=A0A409WA40_9AGAR|nr:hypothetical protein CVT24_012996 [Panaeolus cyanescens]
MCAISRNHIFESIDLPCGETLHNLAELFRSNPIIGAVVRSMNCDFSKATLNNSNILPFLELKNLTSLSVTHINSKDEATTLWVKTLLENYLTPTSSAALPSLKTLSLARITNLNHKTFVLSQSLETLSLSYCSFANDKTSLSHPSIHSKPNSQLKFLSTCYTTVPLALLRDCSGLEELEVFNGVVVFSHNNKNIGLQDSGSPPLLPSLKRLKIHLTGRSDHLNLPYDAQYPQFRVLMNNSPELEQLSLEMSGARAPFLSYPNHNQLKVLNVKWIGVEPPAHFLEREIELLSSLQVPSLESLSLNIDTAVFISNANHVEQFEERFAVGARQVGRLIGDQDGTRFPLLKSSSLLLDLTRFVQVRSLRRQARPMRSCGDMKQEFDSVLKTLGSCGDRYEFTSELVLKDFNLQ